jgi:cell wall-associated NlpC family hydrolase
LAFSSFYLLGGRDFSWTYRVKYGGGNLRLGIHLLIIFVIVSLFGSVWAEEQSVARKGVIRAERVNLRTAPDLSGTIITRLSKNTAVTILDQNINWYQVCLADKREGWVAREYVVLNNLLPNRGIGFRDLISFSKNFLRTNYRYGGTSPSGFDCSGFTRYIFGKFGFSIPHKAAEQEKLGSPVLKTDLLPGDLVFFTGRNDSVVNHVGIYIGQNRFIHAASGPGTVCINSLNEKYYQTHYKSARRIADDTELFDLNSLEPAL